MTRHRQRHFTNPSSITQKLQGTQDDRNMKPRRRRRKEEDSKQVRKSTQISILSNQTTIQSFFSNTTWKEQKQKICLEIWNLGWTQSTAIEESLQHSKIQIFFKKLYEYSFLLFLSLEFRRQYRIVLLTLSLSLPLEFESLSFSLSLLSIFIGICIRSARRD